MNKHSNTASRLLDELEQSPPAEYYEALKSVTTARYIKSLLPPHSPLQTRANSLEQSLLEMIQSLPQPKQASPPVYDFLLPAFPPEPIILEIATKVEDELIPLPPSPIIPPTTQNHDDSTSSVLQQHHDLQSTLTTSLAQMASQLKSNSIQFSQSLVQDRAVMEDAQEKLGGNLGVMQKEGGRLEGYKRKAGGTTCFVIAAVGGVALSWVMVFLLIKVS